MLARRSTSSKNGNHGVTELELLVYHGRISMVMTDALDDIGHFVCLSWVIWTLLTADPSLALKNNTGSRI